MAIEVAFVRGIVIVRQSQEISRQIICELNVQKSQDLFGTVLRRKEFQLGISAHFSTALANTFYHTATLSCERVLEKELKI